MNSIQVNSPSEPDWNEINHLIDLIPCVNKDEGFDVNLIKNSLFNAINRMESVSEDNLKFRECFGRLNFRINYLKRNLDAAQYKNLQGLEASIDQLAQRHGIKRHKATYLDRLRGVSRQLFQMISSTSPEGFLAATRSTKVLSEEYWKEFFDEFHRHPKTLDKVFNEWKIYDHSERVSFWDYLKEVEKQGDLPELKNENEQVLYLTSAEREKYKVSLEMNKDSIVLKGADEAPLPDGIYITVLGPDQQFYAAQKQPGKFQHASFFAGKSVITAGMFLIKDGILKNFVSQSGHYKPEKEEMFKALYYLEEKGIDISKLKMIYGSGGEEMITIENPKEWIEYQNFLQGKVENKKIVPSETLLEEVVEAEALVQEAAKLVDLHGGGIYDKNLKSVIPANPIVIHLKWEQTKNKIARIVGPLPSPPTRESNFWINSAATQEELLRDAFNLAPAFKKMCDDIGIETETRANFGPADACIVKGASSLARKVKQDADIMGISSQESLRKIGDALRGTMIVDHPSKIPVVVQAIINKVKERGGDVVFKNLLAEERQSGYVGVHAKIYLPISSNEKGEGQERSMIVELQIHLDAIMDGTSECVKEQEHLIYEQVRIGNFSPSKVSIASKLLYLTAMEKVQLL